MFVNNIEDSGCNQGFHICNKTLKDTLMLVRNQSKK